MEIEKPKRVTKPKQPDPEKIFLNKCKLFFSSLTARSAQYAYFNIAENTVLLCNSTSPPPNKVHGDRIMQYGIGELTYHFIEFKDTEFFQEFRNFLEIPVGVLYCVHILNVLSLFNKIPRKELCVFNNENGDKVLITKNRKTYDKKNVIGFPVHNFHIVSMVHQWFIKVSDIGSHEHQKQFPFVEMPMKTDVTLTGRVFSIDVDTSRFVDRTGCPIFKNVRPTMKILGLDGLTCASIREFFKRVADTPHKFILYMWAVEASYVLSMTLFENEMVIVRSIRPNILAIPVSNNIVIETRDLLALSEDSNE